MGLDFKNPEKYIIIFQYWDRYFFGLYEKCTLDYIRGDNLEWCREYLKRETGLHYKLEILEECTTTTYFYKLENK